MKKLLSLLLVVAMLALVLCSCGMSADKLKDRLKDMEEDKEISYSVMQKASLEGFKDELEDELYKKMKGDIEKGYSVMSTDGDGYAMILVFENSGDAKDAANYMKEEAEDEKDYLVKRSGKIVFFGSEDLINEIA